MHSMETPRDVSKYMQLLLKIGSVMAFSICLFFCAGLFLIKRLDVPSGILIVFVFLGVVGGFFNVVRELKKLDNV